MDSLLLADMAELAEKSRIQGACRNLYIVGRIVFCPFD